MAQLPQYQAQQTSGGGSSGQISESAPRTDFSGLADAGQALQNLAGAGTNLYLQKQKELKEKQDKFDKQQAIRAFSEFKIADQERQQNFRNNYKDDISQFTKNDLSDQEQFYQNFDTEPLTPGSKEYMSGMYDQYRVQSANEAMSFQAAARGQQVKQNIEVGSKNLINGTRLNPKDYQSNQKQIDDLVSTMSGMVPDQVLQNYATDLRDQNAIAVIRGYADLDPRSTLKEIQKTSGTSYDGVAGLIEKGNINLNSRPVVNNPDGSISTVRSMSVNMDGQEVLLPTIDPSGKNLSNKEAIDLYKKTGQHLGKFDSPAAADKFAQTLHNDQAAYYDSPIRQAVANLSPNALEVLYGGMQREIEAEDRQLRAQQRSEIVSQLDSHFASLASTNTPVLTDAQVAAIQDPEVAAEYKFQTQMGKAYYKVLKGAEGRPLEEQLAMLEPYKPKPGSKTFAEEQKAYEFMRDKVVDQNKDFQDDKVQASLNNAQVAKAYDISPEAGVKATVSYQLNKGIPYHKIAVASKAQVEADADKLNVMLQNQQFDEAKHYMNDLKHQYSVVSLPDSRSGWDVYKNQLKNNKGTTVSSDFLMALQYQDIPQGNEIFQAYKVSMADYTALSGAESIKTLKEQIDVQYQPYANVLTKIPGYAGTTQLAAEKQLLTKYAARLVNQGLPETEAAKKAFKTMYNYEMVNNNRNRLIIPKQINHVDINPTVVQQKMSDLLNVDRVYNFISQGTGKVQDLAKLSVQKNPNMGGGDLYMNPSAAQAFERAQTAMKLQSPGGIIVNSAYRSREAQQKAYNHYLAGGPTAAKPGGSSHEREGGARGIDVQNYAEAKAHLEANGFAYRPHAKDPWHFEYVGPDNSAKAGLPGRLATESERRLYADSLSKTGVWISSGDLMSVTLYSKNADGSLTPARNGNHKVYSFPLSYLQKGKLDPVIHHAVTPKKKSGITSGQVDEVRSSRASKVAKQLSGKDFVPDNNVDFILNRGF